MQPSKTGVETNVNDDERFWEDDLRKKLLKQINKIKAAIVVYMDNQWAQMTDLILCNSNCPI